MQHKSLFAALLCGALCLTACLKNEESPSVTQVRNAKAELLLSEATLNKANAEAAIIQAKAEEKVQAAEVKLKEAEAKMKEADATYRLAEAEAVKAATQLKLVEVQLKEIEVEIAKVQLESDKVELERQKAELLAQKAEYEARIAAAELAKQEYESLKAIMAKELEIALTQLQADLIDAQYNVVAAQKAYDDFLKEIEKEAIEEDIEKFEFLREEAIRLSAEYHSALRELIDMEDALVQNEFLLNALENDLKTATEVKTEKILANQRTIARNLIRIDNLEKYKKEFLDKFYVEGWGDLELDDIKDQIASFEEVVNDYYIAYCEADAASDAAYDALSATWDAYAAVYPILTESSDGMEDYDGYYELGIVYDYTNALFTEDVNTGVNLSDLPDFYGEYVKYGIREEAVRTTQWEEPSDEGKWHTVKMRIHRYEPYGPYEGDVIANVSNEDVELYRFYQEPGEAFGIKNGEPEVYPELGEGITDDWSAPYLNIYPQEFIPMVVNKEGFDKYIAIKQEVVDAEKDYADLYFQGADFIKNWYIENFKDIVEGIEKVKSDAYDAYIKAYDDYAEKVEDLIDAKSAWANKYLLSYESWQPEQAKIQELIEALTVLRNYIDNNKADMDGLRYQIFTVQSNIDAWDEFIVKTTDDDAEYKASDQYLLDMDALKNAQIEQLKAQMAYDDAAADLATLTSDYQTKKADSDAKYTAYLQKVNAYDDAVLALTADPTNTALIDAKNNAETAMNDAWTAYSTAWSAQYTAETAMNTQQGVVDGKKTILESKNADVKACEDIVNVYTIAIATANAQKLELNAQLEDLQAQLKPYEDDLKTYEDAVDKLEEEWNKIVTDAQDNAEWKAVEDAEAALATSEAALDAAEEEFVKIRTCISRKRYFNFDQYEYVTDPASAFPGWEEEIWNSGIYNVKPSQEWSYWSDLVENFAGIYANNTLYTLQGEWAFIDGFYEELIPLSMDDIVYYYHYFADGDKYDLEVADYKASYQEYLDGMQKEVDDIQARLDKVMAGEAAYLAGIDKANDAYAAYCEAQKDYADKYIAFYLARYAWEDLSDLYDYLLYEVADGGDIEEMFAAIDELKAENAELVAENNDLQALKDAKQVIKVLQDEIAVEKSEIADQKVIVETWKKQLDEVMAKIKEFLPEAEEIPAE